MERDDSFDLNLAIREWREEFEQFGALRREDLDELESHLRDSAATEQSAGRTTQQAFLIATRRIGPPCAIAPEFSKINRLHPWRVRVGWLSFMLIVPISLQLIGLDGESALLLAALLLSCALPSAAERTSTQPSWVTEVAWACMTLGSLPVLLMMIIAPKQLGGVFILFLLLCGRIAPFLGRNLKDFHPHG